MIRWTGIVVSLVILMAPRIAGAQTHFNSCFSATGANATVLIDAAAVPTIDGAPLQPGDEVALVQGGIGCFGAAMWNGTSLSIPVWADDPFTPAPDGMSRGEPLEFALWDASAAVEIGLEVGFVNPVYDANTPYRSDGLYEPDAIYNLLELSGLSQPVPPVPDLVASPLQGDAPLTVTVDGSGSLDSDGIVVAYEWEFGDGDASQQMVDAHTYVSPGSYTLSLTVTDDHGAIATTSVEVTVFDPAQNASPEAAIVANPETGSVPLTVDFDGSGSVDSDGVVSAYAWDFADGSVATGVQATHTFTVTGSYLVRLNVTDNDGAVSGATTVIVATNPPGNHTPQAVFSVSPTSGSAPLSVTLDATASTDSDGVISAYQWDLGDGAVAAGQTVQHTYTEVGSHEIVLTVVDDVGAIGVSAQAIVVTPRPSNEPPVASFSATPLFGSAPLTVLVDGSGSSDADGSITSYSWSFGDGGTGVGPTATHTFDSPGSYTINLNVADDAGAFAAASVTIEVSEATGPGPVDPGNQPPVASFVSSQDLNNPRAFTFDASASYDLDGTVTSFVWDFGDGTSREGSVVSHTFRTPDTFAVTLTVVDNEGASGFARVDLVADVSAVLNRPPQVRFSARRSSSDEMTFVFDATGSVDEDGSITAYQWDFGDGTIGSGSQTDRTFLIAGSYAVTLTVTDNAGGVGRAALIVHAGPSDASDRAPVPAFSVARASETDPLVLNFDASASTDPNGSIRTYAWDFGDGSLGDGLIATHTFPTTGAFVVTVTVTDDEGLSAVLSRSVSVGAVLPDRMNTARIGSAAAAGTVAEAEGVWTVTAVGVATDGRADAAEFVYLETEGDFELRLQVLDLQGAASSWAGLTVRSGLADDARHATVAIDAAARANLRYRVSDGAWEIGTPGIPTVSPSFVRLLRRAHRYTAFLSPDGLIWHEIDSREVAMDGSVFVGFLASADDPSRPVEARFTDFHFSAGSPPDVEAASPGAMGEPFPNPFSERAQIELLFPTQQEVTAELFDGLGRRVQRLFQGSIAANVPFDLVVDGAEIPSGVYFVVVRNRSFFETRTLFIQR